MKTHARLLALVIVLTCFGCGGGGTGQSAAGGDQGSSFGPFLTRASGGKPQVVTLSTGGPTITGVAGTAFTKITYSPAPSVANSRIAYVRYGATSSLNIMNGDKTGLRMIGGVFPLNTISWSRDGRLVFDMADNVTSVPQIYTINADGSGMHKISTGGFYDEFPSWSSDNFHIVFQRVDGSGHWQIYSMTASGGSVVNLSNGSGVNDQKPAWTPDGSQILFQRTNGANLDLWKMNSNGTSPTLVLSGTFTSFLLSPTGNQLLVTPWSAGNTTITSYQYPSLSSVGSFANDASTYYDLSCFAPDGSKVLYQKSISGSNKTEMATYDGLNKQDFLNFYDQSSGRSAWEPFPVPIPYVASTGGSVLGTAASGFLYGMNGTAFTSFLSFTATTPGSAVLTADPAANGASNLIYRVSADAITSIKFVNGLGASVNAPTIGTGVKGAIISFNASTGAVASVLTLASKRGVMPVASKRGGQIVYTGAFAAAYDGSGKNLAPGGARQVVLSARGELLSAS